MELDRAIANLAAHNPAMTDKEIATRLGVSRPRVNRRRNSETVQSLIRESLKISENDVNRLLCKSFKVLEDALLDRDPKVRLDAAKHITRLASDAFSGQLNSNEEGLEFVCEFG